MKSYTTKFKETEIGPIPEEWGTVCLEELVDFSNGKTSPSRFDGGKFPVYGANGIIGFSGHTNSPKGSLVVGRVGAYCGSIYFSDAESWVTDNAIKGNAKGNTNPRFLFYLLKTLGLNERAGGSGQPLINQSILNSIMVQDPPQIDEILSSLDDKIELNRKINANLGKLASTLFKKWFVDIGDKLPEGWRMELMTGYAATRTSASSTDNASDSAAEVSLLEKTAHSREWAFFFFVVQYVRKSINFNQSKSCGTTIIQCSVRRSGVRSAGAYLAQSFF